MNTNPGNLGTQVTPDWKHAKPSKNDYPAYRKQACSMSAERLARKQEKAQKKCERLEAAYMSLLSRD